MRAEGYAASLHNQCRFDAAERVAVSRPGEDGRLRIIDVDSVADRVPRARAALAPAEAARFAAAAACSGKAPAWRATEAEAFGPRRASAAGPRDVTTQRGCPLCRQGGRRAALSAFAAADGQFPDHGSRNALATVETVATRGPARAEAEPPPASPPVAAGRVVAVRRLPYANGFGQEIVPDGPRAMAGENRIAAKAVTTVQTGVRGLGVGQLRSGPPPDGDVAAAASPKAWVTASPPPRSAILDPDPLPR